MTVTITIKCDNEAFELTPAHEVARILAKYAEAIKHDFDPPESLLFDINGNRVGSVTVSE